MDGKLQLPTHALLEELRSAQESPCISLYQPTHRHTPENQQDPIRYRNLLTKLEEILKGKYSTSDFAKMMKPFRDLEHDHEFWKYTLEGVVILRSPKIFRVFTLPRAVQELLVVNDSFHLKPLRKFLQSSDRYQLLALSVDEIELYQGSRNNLEKINTGPDVPKNIADALGRVIEKDPAAQPAFSTVRGGSMVVNYGHGGGKDDREIDRVRFFRAVDTAVLEHISNRSGLPLMLVALAEHHHLFHEISQNPHLLAEGITINPKAVKPTELRELAWKVMEPQYHARLDGLSDTFKLAKAHENGSDNLADVAKAALEGKVATLLLQNDHILPGHLDLSTGKVYPSSQQTKSVDDVLDDIGQLVEKNGGKVLLIPGKHMPTHTGLAAIFRY